MNNFNNASAAVVTAVDISNAVSCRGNRCPARDSIVNAVMVSFIAPSCAAITNVFRNSGNTPLNRHCVDTTVFILISDALRINIISFLISGRTFCRPFAVAAAWLALIIVAAT